MMTRRQLEKSILYVSLAILALFLVDALEARLWSPDVRVLQAHPRDRHYVAAKPWDRWIECSPDGEPIEHQLFMARRAGNLFWIHRIGGEYPYEEEFIEEYTTDNELTFEQGISLIARRQFKK